MLLKKVLKKQHYQSLPDLPQAFLSFSEKELKLHQQQLHERPSTIHRLKYELAKHSGQTPSVNILPATVEYMQTFMTLIDSALRQCQTQKAIEIIDSVQEPMMAHTIAESCHHYENSEAAYALLNHPILKNYITSMDLFKLGTTFATPDPRIPILIAKETLFRRTLGASRLLNWMSTCPDLRIVMCHNIDILKQLGPELIDKLVANDIHPYHTLWAQLPNEKLIPWAMRSFGFAKYLFGAITRIKTIEALENDACLKLICKHPPLIIKACEIKPLQEIVYKTIDNKDVMRYITHNAVAFTKCQPSEILAILKKHHELLTYFLYQMSILASVPNSKYYSRQWLRDILNELINTQPEAKLFILNDFNFLTSCLALDLPSLGKQQVLQHANLYPDYAEKTLMCPALLSALGYQANKPFSGFSLTKEDYSRIGDFYANDQKYNNNELAIQYYYLAYNLGHKEAAIWIAGYVHESNMKEAITLLNDVKEHFPVERMLSHYQYLLTQVKRENSLAHHEAELLKSIHTLSLGAHSRQISQPDSLLLEPTIAPIDAASVVPLFTIDDLDVVADTLAETKLLEAPFLEKGYLPEFTSTRTKQEDITQQPHFQTKLRV